MNDLDRCLRPQVQTLCALIAILYLRLVKSRRYHGIILRALIFFRAREMVRPTSFFRAADSNAASIRFYHDGTTTLISNTHLVFGCVNLNAH